MRHPPGMHARGRPRLALGPDREPCRIPCPPGGRLLLPYHASRSLRRVAARTRWQLPRSQRLCTAYRRVLGDSPPFGGGTGGVSRKNPRGRRGGGSPLPPEPPPCRGGRPPPPRGEQS